MFCEKKRASKNGEKEKLLAYEERVRTPFGSKMI